MSAFLFISAPAGPQPFRRVDLARYTSLFAEVEELAAPRPRGAFVTRVLALLLVLVFAIGDTLLVARPYGLTHTVPPMGAPASTAKAVTSL